MEDLIFRVMLYAKHFEQLDLLIIQQNFLVFDYFFVILSDLLKVIVNRSF